MTKGGKPQTLEDPLVEVDVVLRSIFDESYLLWESKVAHPPIPPCFLGDYSWPFGIMTPWKPALLRPASYFFLGKKLDPGPGSSTNRLQQLC